MYDKAFLHSKINKIDRNSQTALFNTHHNPFLQVEGQALSQGRLFFTEFSIFDLFFFGDIFLILPCKY